MKSEQELIDTLAAAGEELKSQTAVTKKVGKEQQSKDWLRKMRSALDAKAQGKLT